MLQVQKIACTNNAGFVMNFTIAWLDTDGNWQSANWDSGSYPIDQSKTSPDLASIGVPSDALAIAPHVHASGGGTNAGSPVVGYAANNQVATYEVKGTTLDYSVHLIN